MILADIILIAFVLFAVLASSIVDIKKREVPDWISYMLISSALLIRLLYAWQSSSWSYLLYGILGFLAMALVGTILFYAKQWGGGDAKLLMGIGAAWGTSPYFIDVSGYFLIYFLLSLAVMGAIYGLIYSLILLVINFKSWKSEYLQLRKDKQARLINYFCIAVALILALISFILNPQFKISLLVLVPLILLYPYFYIMLKAVEKSSMYKYIPVSRLTEGDWIADDSIKKRFNVPSWGIEEKQLIQLRKSKIQKVKIKEGIPFVPSFFFAVIAVLNINFLISLL